MIGRRGEVPLRVERLDLRSGGRKFEREIMPADPAGLLDVGFVNLSADGNSYIYSYRQILSTLYLAEGLS